MYIVYSPVQDKIGIWQDGWTWVAIKRKVPVAAPGKSIAYVYVESIADWGNDWEIIARF